MCNFFACFVYTAAEKLTVMNKRETIERILNRLPKDIHSVKLYILKGNDEADRETYVLVGAGAKFDDEVTMQLTKAEYDVLKEHFPTGHSFITGTTTIAELSIVYRNLMLDELIETL